MSSEPVSAASSAATSGTDVVPCAEGIKTPAPLSSQSDRAILWLRRGDRLVVGVLTGAALLLMSIHWIRLSAWGTRPIDIDHLPQAPYQYEIDINRATWVEWAQFNGIGETLARRIVADRETNGDFESIDDLLRVRGVGKRKLSEMRRHLHVQHAAKPHPETGSPDRAPPVGRTDDSVEQMDSDGEIEEVP